MTSAEAMSCDNGNVRKVGLSETSTRKPSFKCGGPGRGQLPRVTRKTNSVQALTTKFDSMSSDVKRTNAGRTRPKKPLKPTDISSIKKDNSVEEKKVVQTKLPSIEANIEESRLPVKTAIGLFEKVNSEKPSKPVATVKPMLMKIEEKPKPKLVPKDSMCRVRYKGLRRQKETNDNCEKMSPSPDTKLSISPEMEKLTEELKNKIVPKENKSSLYNSIDIKANTANENVPDPNLQRVFEQISQTTILHAQYSAKKVEEKIDVVQNSILQQISQSKVNSSLHSGNNRRFATLLKSEVDGVALKVLTDNEPKIVEQQTDSTIYSENQKSFQRNSSFLWSNTLSEPENNKLQLGKGDTPLPKPPDLFIPDGFYDSLSISSDATEYDDISLGDTYDDIGVAKLNDRNKNESLYCISDDLDSMNIYEDIQSATYELVNRVGSGADVYEDASYESIYCTHSGGSDGSVKSSFEKSNSLYESAIDILEAKCQESMSDVNCEYQTGGVRLAADSDTSNSEEWVEMSDDSDPETSPGQPTLLQIHRKSKRHKNSNNCNKVRANWSELQKRTSQKAHNEDLVAVDNNEEQEHVYESISQTDLSPSPLHDDPADDSDCIDDFESSDEECPGTQLPVVPPTQNNITKSLRAAGLRLRKNFTLRKRDFSRSLKKLRGDVSENKTEDESGGGSKFYYDVHDAGRGLRPSDPPPHPPNDNSTDSSSQTSGVQYADVRMNGTELYAECGLFKQRARSRTGSKSSWYTEAGLYGIGAGPNPGRNEKNGVSKPMFTDEPLYQFYTECVNAQARDDILQHYDSDGYEAINDFYTLINDKRCTLDVKVAMPNLEDFNEHDRTRSTPSFQTQNSTLWCQVPEVENSCIVPTLTDVQRKLQEAKFEILTSEGSYIHSLTVLETHFMPRLVELISDHREHGLLFSNILAVKAVSERLLASLEQCWQDSIMLNGICNIVKQHAEEDFYVYVKFCKHHTAVYRTLRSLIDNNQAFSTALKQLESSEICQSLSLYSFLMLPMQRITRLPLLLGGVLTRLDKTDEEYLQCKAAFDLLNKIVKECDEEATKMDKCEEMLLLSQQLVFPKAVRRIPIISANRCLVKRGTATFLLGKEDSKLTFGRRISKVSIHLLLFTDLLILARRKGQGLLVMDYCARNLVQLQPSPGASFLPASTQKNLSLLTLLENHENKTVEMMLSFTTESDLSRWNDAVSPVLSENPMESVYESWDCPQVIAIYEFIATQPDELSLCIGDIVNVLKKIPDGWYQGERLRDGVIGWFPLNHTQEISSPHVRAKNKKLRYKLLALSGSYLQQNRLNSPT